LEEAKLGRDAEGAENRDAHTHMATRGLGILGAMAPFTLHYITLELFIVA